MPAPISVVIHTGTAAPVDLLSEPALDGSFSQWVSCVSVRTGCAVPFFGEILACGFFNQNGKFTEGADIDAGDPLREATVCTGADDRRRGDQHDVS